MIDASSPDAISLRELAVRFRVSYDAMQSWTSVRRKGPRLESVKVGYERRSTVAAVNAYLAAVEEAKARKPQPKTASVAADRAMEQLKALGL